MSDEDADNEFKRHILMMVQIMTFAIALALTAIVEYGNLNGGESCGKNEVRAEGGG